MRKKYWDIRHIIDDAESSSDDSDGSDDFDDSDKEQIKGNVFRENKVRKFIFLVSNFENAFWMLEQPINNKRSSRNQFLLREFYQDWG